MFLRKEGASLPSSQQHKRQKIAVQERERQKPRKTQMRLAVKKTNKQNQNKVKTTTTFPHRKFNKGWAELMRCVTGNWGWNPIPLGSRANAHQPGLKSILPFQKGPSAAKLWFRPLNNVPNLVFHLMLPLGHCSLFYFNVKVRILNKGLDLKPSTWSWMPLQIRWLTLVSDGWHRYPVLVSPSGTHSKALTQNVHLNMAQPVFSLGCTSEETFLDDTQFALLSDFTRAFVKWI